MQDEQRCGRTVFLQFIDYVNKRETHYPGHLSSNQSEQFLTSMGGGC